MNDAEQRLADVEAALAFHEKTVETLNGVVYDQQQQLDRLTEACRDLADRFRSMQASLEDAAPGLDERPPHY